jgi:Mycothiol maleylpyruvate isomerase N-terminal domain
MGKREELIRAEDERWLELFEILRGLPDARAHEVGVTAEWSVKDLLAHLGCWMAEAAHVLERKRLGTFERQPLDVEARNREFYEACRDLDLPTVRAEMESARTRMLQEWGALPEIDSIAEEWFRESGPAHLEEHLPDLRRFAGSSR